MLGGVRDPVRRAPRRPLRRRRRSRTPSPTPILGAAGAGDIGEMFSDTDPANAGRDSIEMLRLAVERVARARLARRRRSTSPSSPRRRRSRRTATRCASGSRAALGVDARRRQRQGQDQRGHGLDRPRRRTRLHRHRDALRGVGHDGRDSSPGCSSSAARGALSRSWRCSPPIENVFPPVPADTVVALGSCLAARGQGSAARRLPRDVARQCRRRDGHVLSSAGATAPHGSSGAFRAIADEKSERRIRELYGKYGTACALR